MLAELEAASKTKTKAIIAAPKEEDSEAECQRRASCRRVSVVAVVAPDGRNCAVLRSEQLASN